MSLTTPDSLVILPLSPIPPIAYLRLGASGAAITFDAGENYVKQTIRNRYHILTANGVQALTIPVMHTGGEKVPTGNIRIDYRKPWVRNHLRALESAYRSAPFYDHYFPEIKTLLESENSDLREFFEVSFPKWLRMLKITFPYSFSDNYIENASGPDFRRRLKNPEDFPSELMPSRYMQIFNDRFDFAPNLSVLDLLFNEGPGAATILKG